jgi:plastin-1
LRWFNYHLKNANWPKRVTNFSGDVKDAEAYTVLLAQIAPECCDRGPLNDKDALTRAGKVLTNAQKIEVKTFIKPSDIVAGNNRLNLAFTAAIFNQRPGLDLLTKEEMEKAGLMEDDFGDSREERAFRMWINSLGLPGLYINSLYEDCKDGIALLKVMDHIQPGCVAWKNVEMNPSNKFKKVSNCNYVVVVGKQLNFSLVGIGGPDIVDGNKKLLLALVWQMMRLHTLKFLKEVQGKKFGGKEVTEQMIVDWANNLVESKGRSTRMASFKDPSLRNGIFFMDLLFSIEPRVINWDFVTPGETEADALLNAKYALSVARKLGAIIFCLPEDIVEVKPKMILTFVASIMSVAK